MDWAHGCVGQTSLLFLGCVAVVGLETLAKAIHAIATVFFGLLKFVFVAGSGRLLQIALGC